MNKEKPQIFARWVDPTIDEYKQQITQLTNNWNELEDYLNEQIQRSWEIEEQCYETILDKMKEIKENKK